MKNALDSLLLNQNAYKYNNDVINKDILKLNLSKLHKGHRTVINLYLDKEDENVLNITNVWWGTEVFQKLYFNKEKTKIRVSLTYPIVPKYVIKFFGLMKNKYNNINKIEFDKNNNYFLKGYLTTNNNFVIPYINFEQSLNERILFNPSETLMLVMDFNKRYKKLKYLIKTNMNNEEFINDFFTVKNKTLYISHQLF